MRKHYTKCNRKEDVDAHRSGFKFWVQGTKKRPSIIEKSDELNYINFFLKLLPFNYYYFYLLLFS